LPVRLLNLNCSRIDITGLKISDATSALITAKKY
jgi:hypothetical protein